jgi:hypothetical protein
VVAPYPKIGALEKDYVPFNISFFFFFLFSFVFDRLWIQTKMLLQNHMRIIILIEERRYVSRMHIIHAFTKSQRFRISATSRRKKHQLRLVVVQSCFLLK